MKKTIGIIGGMGPAATCDLMQKIIALTDAGCDQEHIHQIADVNTNIPDRTAAILHDGADPLPELIRSARRLETAGAEILLLPCNTAHYYYDGIAAAVSLPLLHMPKETAKVLRARDVRAAGVLATDGVVRSGVYEKALSCLGIKTVYPSPAMQQEVMRLIYDGVKARTVPLSAIPAKDILTDLRERGAEVFLLACTELPIAFEELGISRDCLDPTRVLALAAIRAAGGKTRSNDCFL